MIAGIVAMIMLTASDGWLISAGSSDRIEFWEGHVFFHSADRSQIERANAIIDCFACELWKDWGEPCF